MGRASLEEKLLGEFVAELFLERLQHGFLRKDVQLAREAGRHNVGRLPRLHPAGIGCHIQPLAVKESDEPGFRVLFVCRGPDDFESLVQQPRGNASSGVGDVNLRFAAQFRRHALDGLLKAFAVDVHHSYMVEWWTSTAKAFSKPSR